MSTEMRKRVTVIDGGFSTQLARHVGSNIDGDPLWSARFNAVNPEAVIQSHLDFLEAGVEIILTNTYQASVEGYQKYLNLDYEQSIDLIKSTVKLAHVARDKFMTLNKGDANIKRPLIFASIGPYGAHLHDGSEYTGSYEKTTPSSAIKKWHKVRIDACIDVGVDGLAIETIPCLMEAEAVVDLVLNEYPDTKFWVSFQCKVDGRAIANSENFSDAVNAIYRLAESRRKTENLIAIGVNCLQPSYVSTLLSDLKGLNIPVPLVVYPNSGEKYTVTDGWFGKKECIPIEHYVEEWVELGARYIGGCCRTDSSDIKNIKHKVDSLNYN